MSLHYAKALDGELINSHSTKHDLLACVFHSLLSIGMGSCHMTSGVMSDLPRQLTVIRFQMTALQKKYTCII